MAIANLLDSVATGYGQPPGTIYDWALEPASLRDADYHLPEDLRIRLRIEKFCDRVTRALYSSKPEPAEFISSEKLLIVQLLESELKDMEVEFGRNVSRTVHAAPIILQNVLILSSGQYDSFASSGVASTVFCFFGQQRTKRRLDEAFYRDDLIPWTSTRS